MKGGIGQMLKQAQKIQEDMRTTQERLAQEETTGESGGGMVRITMTGRFEAKHIELDPTLLSEDKEMLEDLIAAAINDAVHRITEKQQQSMAELTAGMPLPPGMKLPF